MKECDICERESINIQMVHDWGRHVRVTLYDKIIGVVTVSVICGPEKFIRRPMRVCGLCIKTVVRKMGSALIKLALAGIMPREQVTKCPLCEKPSNGYNDHHIEFWVDPDIQSESGRKYMMFVDMEHGNDSICAACASIMMLQISESVRENMDALTEQHWGG